MTNLSLSQIMSMSDAEMLADLVESGDVPLCATCKIPLQSSITGRRTIVDDSGKALEYCDDCYYSYEPFQDAVEEFLSNPKNRKPVPE